jgi:hypothetical protein
MNEGYNPMNDLERLRSAILKFARSPRNYLHEREHDDFIQDVFLELLELGLFELAIAERTMWYHPQLRRLICRVRDRFRRTKHPKNLELELELEHDEWIHRDWRSATTRRQWFSAVDFQDSLETMFTYRELNVLKSVCNGRQFINAAYDSGYDFHQALSLQTSMVSKLCQMGR